MGELYDKLSDYGKSDMYPYHMPGHKRRVAGSLPGELFQIDITEIEGFDNLHRPEGILLDLEQRASGLYGSEECYYLINGSTVGILAAVSSAIPKGGHILMTRNCHKSAYHAVYLRNLTVSYLYPKMISDYNIYDGLTAQEVEEALERNPEVQGVLIVSPTYEGRISEIGKIAEVVHKRGIPLIVDEAHGAHLGFCDDFAKNSCTQGADLVIHSVHKTLPALTQTALLHVNGNLVDRGLVRRFLDIYQTSSPSYILMAGIDNAIDYVKNVGEKDFRVFAQRFRKMCEELRCLRKLKILMPDPLYSEKTHQENGIQNNGNWENRCRENRCLESGHQDIGKLVISVNGANLSGKELYDILLHEYHLQPEMASETYVLAMFTVCDSEEAYERMTKALISIDERIGFAGSSSSLHEPVGHPLIACELAEAWDCGAKERDLTESVGRVSAAFVELYPPGVPILVPGEVITEEIVEKIQTWIARGLNVMGINIQEGGIGIFVIPEENNERAFH